jgi:hypothetical protein
MFQGNATNADLFAFLLRVYFSGRMPVFPPLFVQSGAVRRARSVYGPGIDLSSRGMPKKGSTANASLTDKAHLKVTAEVQSSYCVNDRRSTHIET